MLKEFDIFYDSKNVCFQIRTKATSYAIEFDEDEKKDIFTEIMRLVNQKEVTLLETHNHLLSKSFSKENILNVLQGLIDYGLIPPHEIAESGIQFNCQDIPEQYKKEMQKADTLSIWVIGESDMSKAIMNQFATYSFKKLDQITTKAFLALKEENESTLESVLNTYDFCIVDGNKWNPYFLDYFNRLMVRLNKPWLYAGGVEEANLKVGPIFWGRDTGCYNCLLKRLKSNNEFAEYVDSYEDYLKNQQISSKADALPHMPVVYNLAANYILLETMKLFEGWTVPMLWKSMMTLNVFSYDISKHTLLKVPYCDVCKPKVKYNLAAWLEPIKATQ